MRTPRAAARCPTVRIVTERDDIAQRPAADFMSCSELVELVTDYLEGVLPTPELVRFEEHVAACPPCRTYLVQMRQTVATLGRLTEDHVAPEARETLLDAFRSWNTRRPDE